MKKQPRLSFWQIWNMSFGFLGIQFGYALQNANTSRIFQTLGADVGSISILWLAAPVTGLVIQPIIGYMSDKTWNRLGRRRPYFLFGAILASIALVLMPNSPTLWMAAGMLWIMDTSINISMEPFRAFVGDMLPSEQRTKGFVMQSFFIGVGSVIASALPFMLTNWFGVPNVASKGEIPLSVKYSYYLGAIAFITAVTWTVVSTKEYPPEEYALYHPVNNENSESGPPIKQFFRGFVKMPKTMIELAVVQFFSWLALFALWVYTTPAITQHIYGTSDTTSELYNKGADWVDILFAIYNGFAALFSFVIPWVAKKTSRKTAHTISLICGAAGLISMFFIKDPNMLIFSMAGIGIAWASILSMPYAILVGSLPSGKMGFYMGVFNFFIVIPQILAATILGFVLKTFFNSQAIFALIIGGISMAIAAFCVFFVNDIDAPKKIKIKT